jgi:N-acetylmuramoyl-L-alanine amidase
MVIFVLYSFMKREQQILQPSQNQHFQEISNLLILHDIKSLGINTYKKCPNFRIILIPIDFNLTRINTSGTKDLKSPRINTSGAKDLKSRRINTSKKQGTGRGAPSAALRYYLNFAVSRWGDRARCCTHTQRRNPRRRYEVSTFADRATIIGWCVEGPAFATLRSHESPAFLRFCYSRIVRTQKFLIFLPIIAAAALLAHAGPAPQTIPPPPAANPTPSAAQTTPSIPPVTAVNTTLFTVILDPAHGGADPGAHGSTGINESDVVLSFARQIRSALQVQGVNVLLTRDADVDPSFDDRSAIVNAQGHAIFVSLHVSSTGIPGTVRVYSLPLVPPEAVAPAPSDSTGAAMLPPPVEQPNPHPGLRSWDNAQDSFLYLSRRLAELLQTQLTQRFRGSPIAPTAVAVRQLRTIAAPAVAIEVSSVSIADRRQLDAMDDPLAEAVVRAILNFEPLYASGGSASAAPAPAGAQ